ncbi:MAG: PAS domain S-box protein [Acidobacteriia bacterium]|nr:PAS domain S-box protein [Terriglobia bacterium]
MPRKTPGRAKRARSSRPAKTTVGKLLPPRLLEAIPDAIVAVDQKGTIVQINSQTEELFRYQRDELIGRSIETLVPERFRRHHHHHREGYVEQPKIRRMGAGLDLYGVRRDGSEFPVEISLSPVSTEQGMLVLSAIRDISDRKKIEQDLRRAHEELARRTDQQLWEYRTQLASIVDSSDDAIIGKTLDGVITSWNRGAERLYGYTREEMIGKSITRLVPKDRPDEIPSILQRIRLGESVEHYESVRVTKDGRHLEVSLSISPIRDSDGKISGASAIGRDITNQKRTESQLHQAQKMEAVGRLAGGIAHDFNNVLAIITACTELLRDRIGAQDVSAQFIGNIREAANRGSTLTKQLLAFSRRQVVQPLVLDVNERLKEVSKLLRPLMGDDVEVSMTLKPATALVEADPGQLDQIVLNLAVNARDAMPRGGRFMLETAIVEFDETFAREHPPMAAGKYVQLSVSDTGSGMDAVTVSRIFEPFFTTKEVGKGTGLGLATVYGIVRQSGGYIWVYSEPGHGTTFKMYLPSANHKMRPASTSEAEAPLPKRHGTTILLAEDDNIMRQLTRRMLEEQGYTILEAEDGQAALKYVESTRQKIDLMLTDVMMRGLSGPELARRLSTSHPNTKVVYMSGYTGDLIAQHDFSHSGIPLLEKPFTRVAMLKAIHEALESSGSGSG